MDDELNSRDEFYFQWHITERCNRRCLHCYQNGHPIDDLPLADLRSILERMDQALKKWNRTGSLSFTGGEPFLRQPELLALMGDVDQLGSFSHYDILSNGSLISEDAVCQLRMHPKLRRVQVSLEGSKREINDAIRGEGSYDETLRTIRLMKKHGLTVSVMTTVSRVNYGDIPAMVELLDAEGVDTFAVERLVPEGRGQGLRDQMLTADELKGVYGSVYDIAGRGLGMRVLMYRPLFALIAPDDPEVGALCSAGNNALTIMPDGTVYPCRRLPIPIGNVLEDGLFSIWYGSDVLWRIRNPGNLQSKCRVCDLLIKCRGCRASAYACSGDYMGEDPQCWL